MPQISEPHKPSLAKPSAPSGLNQNGGEFFVVSKDGTCHHKAQQLQPPISPYLSSARKVKPLDARSICAKMTNIILYKKELHICPLGHQLKG